MEQQRSLLAIESWKITFPINVRTLDGKTIKIQASPNWTVKRLKEEIGHWKGHGWDKVNLHYRAKRLTDETLLSVYKIEPEGVVHANIRSTGGLVKWRMIRFG